LPSEEIQLKPERAEVLSEAAFAHWKLGGKNITEITSSLAAGIRQLLASGMSIPDKESGLPRPLEARDIAILCWSHDNIAKLASTFRQAGIPAATSHPGLLATPEATLALACLRRLNDPNDTIATAEIISLADSEEPEVWLADRLAHMERGEKRALWRESGENPHPLVARIAALRAELPVLAPREALLRVIAAGDLSRLVIGWQQDAALARTRLANLEALLEMAAQYEDNCRATRQAATISGLLLWFAEQGDAGEDRQAEPGVNAIRLLTHHAAKGLEWPVVILTDLDKDLRTRLWGISATSTSALDATNPLKDRFIRYWPWPFGKQASGIPLFDAINASPIAKRFLDDAVAEAKRLLYVSMTRPREMLILARKQKAKEEPWLSCLGADWLDQLDADAETLNLPSGHAIRALSRDLPAPENPVPPSVETTPLHWFEQLSVQDRLPLYSNPSSAIRSEEAAVVEQARIGEPIIVTGGVDWRILGIAMHACLAASFTDPEIPVTEKEIGRILGGFQLRTCLDAGAVLGQVKAFHEWINERWPGCKPLAEVPIEARLPGGQILNGRMDLVIEIPYGYIIIDHKSSPRGSDQWDNLAQEYRGQLVAYSTLVTAVSERSVLERWIYLPISGISLSI
jgi:ATP-dependent exoDNAse (exonuclease V) beta subunit